MIGAQVSELIAAVCLAMEFHADSEDVARTCHPHPDAVGGPAAGRQGHRLMNVSILGARDDLGALEICGRCSNSGYRAVHCRGGPFGIQFAKFLCAHCLRTYIFGSLAVRSLGRPVADVEAAFCAALLHDLGLIPPYRRLARSEARTLLLFHGDN